MSKLRLNEPFDTAASYISFMGLHLYLLSGRQVILQFYLALLKSQVIQFMWWALN